MHVLRHDTGTSWLNAVADSLDPVTDGLAVGRAKRLGDVPVENYYLATVHDGNDQLRGYAVQPPGRKLTLGCAGPEACAAIAEDVPSPSHQLVGIVSPRRTAARFLRAWTHRTGASPLEGRVQRLMVLREFRPPAQPRGRLRFATAEDRRVLFECLEAFDEETKMDTRGTAVDAMLQRGSVFVWEDDGPRCMAMHNAHGLEGTCIRGVFTPPELRGCGYASHLTAALTSRLQEGGNSPITLFAQTSDEQPNRIYERLGYETVQELGHWWFEYPD